MGNVCTIYTTYMIFKLTICTTWRWCMKCITLIFRSLSLSPLFISPCPPYLWKKLYIFMCAITKCVANRLGHIHTPSDVIMLNFCSSISLANSFNHIVVHFVVVCGVTQFLNYKNNSWFNLHWTWLKCIHKLAQTVILGILFCLFCWSDYTTSINDKTDYNNTIFSVFSQ